MKRFVIASLLSSTLLGAYAETYVDLAPVRNAEPMMENISVPREECSNHWVPDRGGRISYEQQERSPGGAILGGLAGGILGHQVGAGSGKDAATALGVMLGAVVGDRLENRDPRRAYDNRQYESAQREVRRCRTVYDTQARITGYRVAYEYRGQHYTTTTRNHPGQQLRVRVSVDPIEQ